MKEDEASGPSNRELYTLLHLSPDASDEEVHRVIDNGLKFITTNIKLHMKLLRRISKGYVKHIRYYLMKTRGLNSGLELSPKLNKVEEIKEQLEKLRRMKEQKEMSTHFLLPTGTILANLSLPQYLNGDGIMGGGRVASAIFRHEISSTFFLELMGSIGLRSIIRVQTTRSFYFVSSFSPLFFPNQLSLHSTATMAISKSLHDGSINLLNSWTHQLSDKARGNIELVLRPESSIMVGWKMKEDNMSAGGDENLERWLLTLRICTDFCFLPNTSLEVEIGGGRKVLNFSTIRMLYTIGIQILLSRQFNYVLATRKFVIPTSIYFILKRETQKNLKNMERIATEVQEARKAAAKAQQLLENMANRKRNKQQETGGLVITNAIYENLLDVTLCLNFLVNNLGQLKVHDGVKKSGIMGFYDPCPREPKQLHVEYTYCGDRYEIVVDDYGELQIPQLLHKI
ncbi:hypothetical protein CXB51_020057 [Gossypium anomalum]|uniref:DnaJ-like protein C11 C-terminal domain-containing protein n=1 Tax=Gossypium anomalum TaxID=47600 RepID=A0A8J6CTB8_9ROSI|nr:hypothetical protein CXB51_020057 [Gossypium anomalum]